jgi:hypothetical protein
MCSHELHDAGYGMNDVRACVCVCLCVCLCLSVRVCVCLVGCGCVCVLTAVWCRCACRTSFGFRWRTRSSSRTACGPSSPTWIAAHVSSERFHDLPFLLADQLAVACCPFSQLQQTLLRARKGHCCTLSSAEQQIATTGCSTAC